MSEPRTKAGTCLIASLPTDVETLKSPEYIRDVARRIREVEAEAVCKAVHRLPNAIAVYSKHAAAVLAMVLAENASLAAGIEEDDASVESIFRAELERTHRHREYGYFGMYGGAGYAWRAIGRPGCQICELLGRPMHETHGRPDGKLYGGCLAWAEEGD